MENMKLMEYYLESVDNNIDVLHLIDNKDNYITYIESESLKRIGIDFDVWDLNECRIVINTHIKNYAFLEVKFLIVHSLRELRTWEAAFPDYHDAPFNYFLITKEYIIKLLCEILNKVAEIKELKRIVDDLLNKKEYADLRERYYFSSVKARIEL